MKIQENILFLMFFLSQFGFIQSFLKKNLKESTKISIEMYKLQPFTTNSNDGIEINILKIFSEKLKKSLSFKKAKLFNGTRCHEK